MPQNHVIVLGEEHLRRQLGRYLRYYHRAPTHLSPAENAPEPRGVESPELGYVMPACSCRCGPGHAVAARTCADLLRPGHVGSVEVQLGKLGQNWLASL